MARVGPDGKPKKKKPEKEFPKNNQMIVVPGGFNPQRYYNKSEVDTKIAQSSGTPGGSNQYVQFNSNGVFGGSNQFQFDGTKVLVNFIENVTPGNDLNFEVKTRLAAGEQGNNLTFTSGSAAAVGVGGAGGAIQFSAGSAQGSGNNHGGDIEFYLGEPTGTGAKGIVKFMDFDATVLATITKDSVVGGLISSNYFRNLELGQHLNFEALSATAQGAQGDSVGFSAGHGGNTGTGGPGGTIDIATGSARGSGNNNGGDYGIFLGAGTGSGLDGRITIQVESAFRATLHLDSLTADRIYAFPDVAGTLMLGAASATDNAIARFDGTTGKLIQNSVATIDDAGGIATTIANGGNSVALTLTQNDTTNNPRALVINNTTSGDAIEINSTQASAIAMDINTATTSANVFDITNTGVLAASGTRALMRLDMQNASASAFLLYLDNDGSGTTLQINDTLASKTNGSLIVTSVGDNWGIDIDKDITNANTSRGSLRIDQKSVVNDAATYTKTVAAVQITSGVTETSGTITDSAIVLDINQTHADATGNVVDIDNDGVGIGLNIRQDGTPGAGLAALLVDNNGGGRSLYVRQDGAIAANERGFFVLSDNVDQTNSGARLVEFKLDRTGDTADLLYLQQDGIGRGIFLDHNSSGIGLQIDQDANSASSATGISLDVDNAGAGDAIGMDMSTITSAAGANAIGLRIAAPSGATNNYALQLSSTAGTAAGGITFGTDVNLYRSAADTLQTDDQFSIFNHPGVTGFKIMTGGATINQAAFMNTGASGSGAGAGMIGYSNDGAALASGDRLGFFLLGGSTNASNSLSHAVGMTGFTTEAWGAGTTGGELRFEVTANGTSSRGVVLTIQNDGKLAFGSAVDTNLYRSAANTLKTDDSFIVGGDLTITDAKNIILDTTTGTKIANSTSQKLGFWNATPIVQPTTAIAAATFVTNTSLIANDTATFDGYTIGQVVKALRNVGLLA